VLKTLLRLPFRKLYDRIDTASREAELLRIKASELQQAIDSAATEAAKLQAEQAAAAAENAALVRQVELVSNELSQISKTNLRLISERDQRQMEGTRLSDQVTTLSHEFQQVVLHHAAVVEDLEVVRAENRQAANQRDRLGTENEALAQRIVTLSDGLQDLANRYGGTVQTLEETENDNRRLADEKAALERRLSELTSQAQVMAERIDLITAENNRLDQALHQAQEQGELLVRRHDNVAKSLDGLTAENEALTREVSRLRAEAAEVERRQQTLVTEREDMGRARDAIASELQKLTLHYADLQSRLEAIRVPGLLITTLPKSGTYFISDVLAKGLSIKPLIVSNQYFPYDTIRYYDLKKLAAGNAISQDHFDASPINLSHINTFFDRIVVHTRDPRQAMISWLHFISIWFSKEHADKQLVYPPLPENYFDMPLASKIDWGIKNWLPLLIEWTEGWVKAAATEKNLKIKITRYEDFIANEAKFVDDLLHFFGVAPERFQRREIPLDEAHHFRKGETDEWRRVMTRKQIAEANRRIPRALAKQMGWSLDEK